MYRLERIYDDESGMLISSVFINSSYEPATSLIRRFNYTLVDMETGEFSVVEYEEFEPLVKSFDVFGVVKNIVKDNILYAVSCYSADAVSLRNLLKFQRVAVYKRGIDRCDFISNDHYMESHEALPPRIAIVYNKRVFSDECYEIFSFESLKYRLLSSSTVSNADFIGSNRAKRDDTDSIYGNVYDYMLSNTNEMLRLTDNRIGFYGFIMSEENFLDFAVLVFSYTNSRVLTLFI